MEFWNFVQQSCAKCHYIFFCQIKVLLGLWLAGKLRLFFCLIPTQSLHIHISNCNILVHKREEWNWVSKITCPKIGKMRRGFVTTLHSYLWNCSKTMAHCGETKQLVYVWTIWKMRESSWENTVTFD